MAITFDFWTEKEEKELRQLKADGMGWADIGAALNRTAKAVKQRYYVLRQAGIDRQGGRPKGSIVQCRRHPMGKDPCIGIFCKELPRDKRRKVNRNAGYFLCEGCRKACQSVYDGRA
jgi:hypothetical protein